MRTCIALAVLWPAVVVAQEARQQAVTPEVKKWHDEQVAIATANAAGLAKKKEQIEKVLVDLDRREKAVMVAFKDVFGQPHPQAFDLRFIEETGEQRRPRVESEQRSASRLDSIRSAGEPVSIANALTIRKTDAEKAIAESMSLLDDWKRLLRNSERALESLKADDNPSNPADLKAWIKAWIDHFERAIRLARGSVEFETKRSNELRGELTALAKQMEGVALR